jgi:hypothetical protein
MAMIGSDPEMIQARANGRVAAIIYGVAICTICMQAKTVGQREVEPSRGGDDAESKERKR